MLRGWFSFLGLAALASLLLFSYSLIADSRSLPELKTHPLPANLADRSALAAARHELGHALGIWGHSPLGTDVMYFAQTRDIPPISSRDVNTLKKVYQQPTKLGWEMDKLLNGEVQSFRLGYTSPLREKS
ncbi:MAG: hypothetical protein ACKPI8_08710 [Microcystis panniformis]